MSFSTQVKEELNSIHKKENCCKKSYVLGAIFSAKTEENGKILLTLTDSSTIQELCAMLKTVFRIIPEKKEIKRGCYSAVELTFESSRLTDFLNLADRFLKDPKNTYEKIISEIKCENCKSAFVRALFAAAGSVSDPHRSFTLEIRLQNSARASFVRTLIEQVGLNPPSLTDRRDSVGLFYRNESGIEEFLTFCGANHMLFSFFNIHVEKDIRNAENRATNCVAKNISRSVKATTHQIAAIEALMANDMFDELSSELQTTAKLRLENQEVSLSELADIHTPPISKSGLSHRLSKICEEAKRRRLI